MDELGKAMSLINPLSTKATKWSNTLKQFDGKLPTNCLSVFDHFVGLVLKGLRRFTFIDAFLQDTGMANVQELQTIIQDRRH